jgi:hypothetical protein
MREMNHYKLAIQQDIIVQLLAQLTVDYQNSKSERKEIAQSYLGSEEEFSFEMPISIFLSLRLYDSIYSRYRKFKGEAISYATPNPVYSRA